MKEVPQRYSAPDCMASMMASMTREGTTKSLLPERREGLPMLCQSKMKVLLCGRDSEHLLATVDAFHLEDIRPL